MGDKFSVLRNLNSIAFQRKFQFRNTFVYLPLSLILNDLLGDITPIIDIELVGVLQIATLYNFEQKSDNSKRAPLTIYLFIYQIIIQRFF